MSRPETGQTVKIMSRTVAKFQNHDPSRARGEMSKSSHGPSHGKILSLSHCPGKKNNFLYFCPVRQDCPVLLETLIQIRPPEGFGLIVVRKFSQQKVSGKCQEPSGYICENVIACNNGILLPKLF